MPIFYFDVDDGAPALLCEGHDLESLAVAKCQAVQMAGRIICDAAEDFWERAEMTLTVSDSHRLTMFTLQIIGTEAPVVQRSRSAAAINGCDEGVPL